jgi:hypothetical protein
MASLVVKYFRWIVWSQNKYIKIRKPHTGLLLSKTLIKIALLTKDWII